MSEAELTHPVSLAGWPIGLSWSLLTPKAAPVTECKLDFLKNLCVSHLSTRPERLKKEKQNCSVLAGIQETHTH
jgi:hypothetical protein